MEDHAADKLHIEVPHIEHATASFANDGESLDQQLIKSFFQYLVTLGFDLFGSVGIGLGLILDAAQPVLNAAAKLVSFGAQLGISELLCLRLKRIDGFYLRHQVLDFALVLGPEDLGYYSVNQLTFLQGYLPTV